MRALLIYMLALMTGFNIFGENRALLVGIGRYQPGTGWSEIHGDADVDLLLPILTKNGYNDTITLKNSKATKSAIVNALKSLATRCKAGDKVYFHFSGHGQPVADINGDEGKKGFDEAIVPYDAYKTITSKINGKFYNGENHLIDDELNSLFARIKDKLGSHGEFFIAIDACYSDDMERASDTDEALLPPTRGTSDKLNIKRDATSMGRHKPKPFLPGAKMYVVSACKSNECNFEYKASDGKTYGSLTYFIFLLMNKTTDFYKWAHGIETKTPSSPEIFQVYQHPQTRIYR